MGGVLRFSTSSSAWRAVKDGQDAPPQPRRRTASHGERLCAGGHNAQHHGHVKWHEVIQLAQAFGGQGELTKNNVKLALNDVHFKQDVAHEHGVIDSNAELTKLREFFDEALKAKAAAE